MVSYASLGRVKTSTQSTKSSSNQRSTLDSSGAGKHHPGWKHLDEDNSTKHLAWPEETHHVETHALSDFPIQGGHPDAPGIQVQTRVDMV
jgi:hypothetical protein